MSDGPESLRDFDIRSDRQPSMEAVLVDYQRFCNNIFPHLKEPQLKRLFELIQSHPDRPSEAIAPQYGADYDLTGEVDTLIMAVRALRQSVMTDDGRLIDGTTAKEMREMVTASSNLLQFLMKAHEKLMSFERQRVLERTVSEVLLEIGGEETVNRFVKSVEERLANI